MSFDSLISVAGRGDPAWKNINLNLKNLNDVVLRGDIETIIKSKNLFWQQFTAIFAMKRKKMQSYFDVEIANDKACVKGSKVTISVIEKQIELIRTLALEAFEQKIEVKRILISLVGDYFLRRVSQEEVDLTNWLSINVKDKLDKFMFKNYVQPYLTDFFQSLQYSYSKSTVTQLVREDEDEPPFNKKVTAIRIVPKQEPYFIYQIKPAEIPPSMHPSLEFYDCYKKQFLCDYELISTENTSFKVHGIVLAIYAGNYFETLLSKNMKENIEKSIRMDASSDVLQSFIDYIYLGPKCLEDRFFNVKEPDVYGILQFAHAHQLTSLFKKTINLLILSTSVKDHETVKYLAELYKDEDLQRLADHLNPPPKKIRIDWKSKKSFRMPKNWKYSSLRNLSKSIQKR